MKPEHRRLPVNVNTKLDEKLAKTMVYGKDQVKSLIIFDWNYINANRNQWVERWNKEITSK